MAEDELSPQEATRVRRLLADARHTDPMPAEVAARMDAVLGDLAAEPPGAATPTSVVPLADRRRRAGRLLLAAAAVVVAGIGVGQVVGGSQGGQDESAAMDSGEPESAGRAAPDRDGPAAADQEGGATESDPGAGAVIESQRTLADVPSQRIRPDRFVGDAQRARTVATARDTTSVRGLRDRARDELRVPPSAGCQPGVWGGGRYVAVHYGATPGWLVIRRPLGKTQVADLFLCGEDAAERSATLPFD